MPTRIVVMEDNEANLQLMAYLLRAFGYEPLAACDGEQGLALLASKTPDLIICDLDMPKINGFEVARELRSRLELRHIPLVAVTALAMVGDRDKVLKAGFDGYIPKPISPEEFVSQIEAFLPPEKHSHALLKSDATQTPPTQLPPKRATVLAVDDSPTNLSLIRSMLEPFGYEVITAKGYQEAVKLSQERDFDLILSDLRKPGKSGVSFLEWVKQNPQARETPFLLLCSSPFAKEERERIVSLGVDKILDRSVDPKFLVEEIEAVLKKSKGK